MSDKPTNDWLAEQFEQSRPQLRGVAYRLLGSAQEAEDAVQEAWLRLNRTDTSEIQNVGGWLNTVVSRVCLDVLRSRKAHREGELSEHQPGGTNPEQEALLADAVGFAMLVVLQQLGPAERVAFVLHDLFDMSFDEIAPVVGRSVVATRQLASRARRRVQGGVSTTRPDVVRQKQLIDAFLTASREGNFAALLEALDPEVVFRADQTAAKMGGHDEVRGAEAIAKLFQGRAQAARSGLIDGKVGVLVAPGGRLLLVLRLTLREGKIAEIEAVADPEHLAKLQLGAF
jgi:RNA polymerase sigma factor (sigma-70 family)